MNQSHIKGVSISDLERAYDKMHAWFFAFPHDEFTLNELCKNLDIAKTTGNIVVGQLEKEGLLVKRVIGKLWRIKAIPESTVFIARKIPFNLQHVYKSGIIGWVSQNMPNGKCVILFGSYRKGDDIPASDLDIAVEIAGNAEMRVVPLTVKEFGYRTNVLVNVHIFCRKKIDLNVFAAIANGIVLSGFLEVKP